MTIYAKARDRKVVEVIDVEASYFDTLIDDSPGFWLEATSARKLDPYVGCYWDYYKDIFAHPQPHASWTLNSNGEWEPPTAEPDNGKANYWDESSKSWKEVIKD